MATDPEAEESCARCGHLVQRICVGCDLPEDECDCNEEAEQEE